MKRTAKKIKFLKLSKETLHLLDPMEIQKAVGGACFTAASSCPNTTNNCCQLN